MLEHLTEEARQALVMGQEAARGLRYDSLDSGSLLLGLLTAHTDPGIKALAQQGIHFEAVRAEVMARRPAVLEVPGKRAVPYTPGAMLLLEQASWEAKRLRHRRVIAPGHLLLAMQRQPETVAAQVLAALGADFSKVEMAVAAWHMPSMPEANVELPAEFRRLLIQVAGWAWPRPRFHFAAIAFSVCWYLVTFAVIVAMSWNKSGPELAVGLSAAGLVAATALSLARRTRARIPAPPSSSVMPIPPELKALVASWGMTDFAIWLRDDYQLDDHALRIGRKARMGVSREVFNRPSESGFVVAHELAHLLRNDSARGSAIFWLHFSLLFPVIATLTPAIWAIGAASIYLHSLAVRWAAEIGSDHIAVRLAGYPQIVSFMDRVNAPRYWPGRTHPPVALRLWLARRATVGIPRGMPQEG